MPDFRRGKILWHEIEGDRYFPFGLRERKAQVYHLIGLWDELLVILNEDLMVAKGAGLMDIQARCLMIISQVFSQRGNQEDALIKIQEAQNLYRAIGNKQGLYQCHLIQAKILFQLGKYGESERLTLELLQENESRGNQEGAVEINNFLGVIYRYTERTKQALDLYPKIIEYYRHRQRLPELARSLINIGNIHCDRQEFSQALEYYRQAETVVSKIGSAYLLYYLDYDMAISYAGLGELNTARAYCLKALHLAERLGDKIGRREVEESLKKIYSEINNKK